MEDLVRSLYRFLRDNDHGGASCLKGFPHDTCYFATFLAAIVLERFGHQPALWVFGHRPSTGAHVWCECEGRYIDLTSGQYSDCPDEYVFAEKGTCANSFLSSFDIVETGAFDERFKNGQGYCELVAVADEFIASM